MAAPVVATGAVSDRSTGLTLAVTEIKPVGTRLVIGIVTVGSTVEVMVGTAVMVTDGRGVLVARTVGVRMSILGALGVSDSSWLPVNCVSDTEGAMTALDGVVRGVVVAAGAARF
jgi:hypothetical protein